MRKYTTLGIAIGCLALSGVLILSATSSAPGGPEDSPKKGSQSASKGLQWHTFDKGVKLAQKQNKMLVVDFYTDWCHWCKVMDKETFADKEVVEFASKNVVMAKINAETNEQFAYKNAKYSGRQLTAMFGIRGFPSTVFIDSKGDLITTVSGFIPADRFSLILKYLSENWYQKMKFDEFVKKEEGKS